MKQPILLSNDTISGLCRGLSLLLHAGVGVGDGLALLTGISRKGKEVKRRYLRRTCVL